MNIGWINMIIEQSVMSMSVEHKKSESVSYVQTNSISGFGQQFNNASALLATRVGLKDEEVVVVPSASELSASKPSILIMTDDGLKFKAAEANEIDVYQQSYKRARLFKALFEAITGKKLPVIYYGLKDVLSVGVNEVSDLGAAKGRVQRSEATDFLSEGKAMQLTVHVAQYVEEYELSRFVAAGSVKTSDGRVIDLNLNMTMERQHSETHEMSFSREVRFKDPLLLNFDGTAAELSDSSFEFDIDADGETEWMHYLAGANGWLALDGDENGKIDNGSELFGGTTGQGFNELRQFDEDNNGFIDAADSVFEDLLIWTKTEALDHLMPLTKSAIGAIYLGSEETPFDLKGDNNQMLGKVSKSGIYLTEAGNVGSVQQIDMAV
jgi:hypothetical protein